MSVKLHDEGILLEIIILFEEGGFQENEWFLKI
jgi:hypothetical protein